MRWYAALVRPRHDEAPGGDLGDPPDLLETLAHRLERDRIRARLFGGSPEPLRVGRFVLERPLGAGSMGVIYVARDEQLHRTVALKLVRSSAQTDEGQARLLREAQAAARLSHPNVATVFEAGLWEGRVYMAMELVRGRTLRQWLQTEHPDERRILDVFLQAASGLAAAHEEGLVHRDFKPENVMVGDDGRVRVLDFGLARAQPAPDTAPSGGPPSTDSASPDSSASPGAPPSTDSASPDSRSPAGSSPSPTAALLASGTLAIAGTPAYMAPEQHRGEAVDARADVFAFCVALHEALYGERPFPGDTLEEIQASIAAGAVKVPRGKSVSSWLDKAVRKGLSFRPEDRWPSMRALAGELARDRSPRRRWWALLAVIVLLAAGLALALALRGAPPDPAATRPARPPEATAAYERALANMHGGGPIGPELRRALSLDPSFTEARLQLLLGQTTYITSSDRDEFRKVQQGRASLSPYEQALVDALEPVFNRHPSDWAEGARRVEAAIERFPGRAVLWSQLAEYEYHQGLLEKALEHHRRALRDEPGLVHSVSEPGLLLIHLGRIEEGRAALAECAGSPAYNPRCMALLAHLLSDEGDCGEMEALARQMIARGAAPGEAHWFLASALAGQRKPVPAVVQAVERAAEEVPDSIPMPLRQVFRLKVSLWSGDFEEAERAARDLGAAVEASDQRLFRAAAAGFLAQVLEETGREVEAADVAMDFLARQDAWEPNPTADDTAVAEDATPVLLSIAHAGGRISRADFLARRGAWLVEWEVDIPAPFRGELWLRGYAHIVHSKESARDALDALATFPPVPAVEMKSFARWGLGAALLLAGKPAEAIPVLERATRSCKGLMAPAEHTRALAWLGRAYQETGDAKAACRAYRALLARWDRGKGRSVTAERVRGWMREVPCEAATSTFR